MKRTIRASAADAVGVSERLTIKWKSGDKRGGKPLRWGVSGDELHHDSGRRHLVVRVFDRVKDWYYEHIVEEDSGRVVRHVEENLKDHKNHGSAKKP